MNWAPVLAVSIGAAAGALLRWQLGVHLNSFFPVVPPGTLAANLIGGYIIGLTIAFLAQAPNIAPEWRLLIITGFCGGLTTFSTFSAEVVTRLQDGQLAWAMARNRDSCHRVADHDLCRARDLAIGEIPVRSAP